MNHVPEADRTPDGPVYEGRLLARPDDELVDQGAAFDAKTLVTRRRMLGLVGAGVGAVTLAACYPGSSSSSSAGSVSGSTTTTAASGSSIAEIPEETNGPYPADGTNGVNVLQESGIVRSDLTSSLMGERPLRACRLSSRSLSLTWPTATSPSRVRRSTRGSVTPRASTRCTPRALRTRRTYAASRSLTAMAS